MTTQAKHTPGQWRWSTIQRHNPQRNILLGDEREIANVELMSIHEKEDEPNARLIASAPALLEALQATTEHLSDWYALCPGGVNKNDEAILAQARAAILAATLNQ